jgi:polar amino acid transport system substrate-binding protein
MKNLSLIVSVAAIVLSLGAFLSQAGVGQVGHQKTEPQAASTYQRVLDRSSIRCGYVMFPPHMMKDPNSGKLSGISYDLMNAVGEKLQLKIDWAEEVGYGDMITAVNSGRVDAICNVVGINTNRAKYADFLTPPYYAGVSLWVREGDSRFASNDLARLNADDVAIAKVEGTTFDAYIREDFPKAKSYALPQSAPLSDQMMAVATHKADATILDSWLGYEYTKNNPGQLRNLNSETPYRIDPVAPMIGRGQDAFKAMMDSAITEVIQTGKLHRIIAGYQLPKGTLFERAHPFVLHDPKP